MGARNRWHRAREIMDCPAQPSGVLQRRQDGLDPIERGPPLRPKFLLEPAVNLPQPPCRQPALPARLPSEFPDQPVTPLVRPQSRPGTGSEAGESVSDAFQPVVAEFVVNAECGQGVVVGAED